jgi:hypothetical protein
MLLGSETAASHDFSRRRPRYEDGGGRRPEADRRKAIANRVEPHFMKREFVTLLLLSSKYNSTLARIELSQNDAGSHSSFQREGRTENTPIHTNRK